MTLSVLEGGKSAAGVGPPKGKTPDPYGFDPGMEAALALLCSKQPRFWARLGAELDPAAIATPAARRALEACKSIAADAGGAGPDSPVLVVQRLRRWREEGTVTHEEIAAVVDLFEKAADAGLPEEEGVVREVAPVLRRRAESAAMSLGVSEFAKRKDLLRPGGVVEQLSRAARIGQAAPLSIGTRLGPASFRVIEKIHQIERLPTGIVELDAYLQGGPPRGTVTLIGGKTGGAKSMTCSHGCARWAEIGFHVVLASLELPKAWQFARVIANLTDTPINALLEDDAARSRAEAKIEALKLAGILRCEDFTPGKTTAEDVFDFVKRCEDEEGRKVDVLVVDYDRKLGVLGMERAATHEREKVISDVTVAWAKEGNRWYWSPVQAKNANARKGRSKNLDIDDLAGSSDKSRDADLNINVSVVDGQATFFVGKNRYGPMLSAVGPLAADLACGQVAPVERMAPLPF